MTALRCWRADHRARTKSRLLKQRQALGQDGYDEVWEGEYHMAPMAHPPHGYLDDELAVLLRPLALGAGLVGTGAFNLGSPDDYRVPDRGLHRGLPTTTFVPTAAVVVEIVSPVTKPGRSWTSTPRTRSANC
jgi:hypothetical protein